MSAQQWFPAAESNSVVGRFVDIERIDKKRSEAAGKAQYFLAPALHSKVAGSADVSSQIVKPFNKNELIARFPGAWDHYEEHRNIPEPTVPVFKAIKGTPISEVDFIGREKLRQLSEMGFSTIEQLAGMSDATVQNMGRGANSWRKKAQDYLKRT